MGIKIDETFYTFSKTSSFFSKVVIQKNNTKPTIGEYRILVRVYKIETNEKEKQII